MKDKLKELVPPPELCQKIPYGEFDDSAFMWVMLSNQKEYQLHKRTVWIETNHKYFPAPTLQEILAALPPYGKNEQILACCVPDWADFDARVFGENWRVGYTGDCSINDKNPATAALKLWLKVK